MVAHLYRNLSLSIEKTTNGRRYCNQLNMVIDTATSGPNDDPRLTMHSMCNFSGEFELVLDSFWTIDSYSLKSKWKDLFEGFENQCTL